MPVRARWRALLKLGFSPGKLPWLAVVVNRHIGQGRKNRLGVNANTSAAASRLLVEWKAANGKTLGELKRHVVGRHLGRHVGAFQQTLLAL